MVSLSFTQCLKAHAHLTARGHEKTACICISTHELSKGKGVVQLGTITEEKEECVRETGKQFNMWLVSYDSFKSHDVLPRSQFIR